jgi:hypothetical protein
MGDGEVQARRRPAHAQRAPAHDAAEACMAGRSSDHGLVPFTLLLSAPGMVSGSADTEYAAWRPSTASAAGEDRCTATERGGVFPSLVIRLRSMLGCKRGSLERPVSGPDAGPTAL